MDNMLSCFLEFNRFTISYEHSTSYFAVKKDKVKEHGAKETANRNWENNRFHLLTSYLEVGVGQIRLAKLVFCSPETPQSPHQDELDDHWILQLHCSNLDWQPLSFAELLYKHDSEL